MSTCSTERDFACSHCQSPNPARDGDRGFVRCHACQRPTPTPSGQRSRRLLSHASGETCPFFCDQSRTSRHRLCSHTSAEAAALQEAALPWAPLLGVFLLSALLGAAVLMLLLG